MARFKINGYVIRGISMGETSRIITLFTQEKGKLKFAAKGARKTAAKKGGRLELFSLVACEVYQKENVELGTLASVDLIEDYPAIASDAVKFGLCSAFCEILEKSIILNEPNEELFKLTGEILNSISESGSETLTLLFWAAFIKILTLLGYQPHLYECVICGRENKNRAAHYDPVRGGIICSKDIPSDARYSKLSAKSLIVLQGLLCKPFVEIVKIEYSKEELKEIEKFILEFADYHTGLRRNLKSFRFLSQLKMK